jgi:V/A-type H+-transporting ATPase subunit F
MKENIAVVGSIDSILIFKSVGFDVFGVDSEAKTRNVLNKLITDYKVIFITDNFAKYVEDIIVDTQNSAYPAVIVIPSGTEKSDYALKQISQGVEKALGVNILLNEEDK